MMKLLLRKTIEALEEQLNALPRKDIAVDALQNSKAILVNDLE